MGRAGLQPAPQPTSKDRVAPAAQSGARATEPESSLSPFSSSLAPPPQAANGDYSLVQILTGPKAKNTKPKDMPDPNPHQLDLFE